MVKSTGKGTIMVETKKGMRFIKDVLFVPNLKENLLSIGQMTKKGYTNEDTVTQQQQYAVKRLLSLQKKLSLSRDVEVDENATWNWEEEKFVKNISILVQQPQEETKEVAKDLEMLSPSPQ
ncbi:hypothetical protein CR513_40707, partial [Mucuna pruriens]